MKVELLVIGKVKQGFVNEGIAEYEKRIKHFVKFKINRLPSPKIKSKDEIQIVNAESLKLLSQIDKQDNLILLEIGGKSYNTLQFSKFIDKNINGFGGKTIFLIGGAYGVSDELKKRANHKISMSEFTFTHDMAQLILLEQLYRGYTVLNKIPYHH
ncbi:MAG: 23S rRNA (pseudouridine(1915)-N(3))-methyltransferase RlmH [Bacteroidia bacterium]|nr:23S rRNA (pseudouridine(1915)-N(3))-methyltransferase RlmH [Bacteroidia bacterium]